MRRMTLGGRNTQRRRRRRVSPPDAFVWLPYFWSYSCCCRSALAAATSIAVVVFVGTVLCSSSSSYSSSFPVGVVVSARDETFRNHHTNKNDKNKNNQQQNNQQQQQQHETPHHHKNLFEHMWLKIQKATVKQHNEHHRTQQHPSKEDPVIIPQQRQQEQQQAQQQQQSQQQSQQQQAQAHNKQQQPSALSYPTQQRRRALYKHSLRSHYAGLLTTSAATAAAAKNHNTATAKNENDNANTGVQQQQQQQQAQAQYKNRQQTAAVRAAFHAYTHRSEHPPPFTATTTEEQHPTTMKQQQQQQQQQQQSHYDDNNQIDRTTSLHAALPPFPQSKVQANLDLVRRMFQHGYDSYMVHAFYGHHHHHHHNNPSDNSSSSGNNGNGDHRSASATTTAIPIPTTLAAGEVHPLTCQPGQFDLVQLPALTLVDSLDSLLVMGNATEFARACERLRQLAPTTSIPISSTSSTESSTATTTTISSLAEFLFATDRNVSVFETNIRVLGGLLSAHQLAEAVFLDNQHKEADDDNKSSSSSRLGNAAATNNHKRVVALSDVFDGDAVRWGPVVDDDGNRGGGGSQHDDDGDDDDEEPLCDAVFDERMITAAVLAKAAAAGPCDSGTLSLQDCGVQQTYKRVKPAAATKKNQTKTAATASAVETEYWKYDGFLLELALDIGSRLLPAFATPTGIPYGTVNLLHGVPVGETPVASLAGGGTLSLEFELLSRLTGDLRFGKAAKLAARALFLQRSKTLDLFGKHIDTRNGAWTETLSGIGSNSDSYLEYLVKHYLLFPEDDDFWIMFKTAYAGVFTESRMGEWYADVDMNHGTAGGGRRVLESLAAFYPGLQVLLGEVTPAARSLNSFFMVREVLGFLPERFNYGIWNLDLSREGAGRHPLRPELLESCYFMHRATQGLKSGGQQRPDGNDDSSWSGWQWAADFALHKLESATRTSCGYAGLRELKPHTTGSLDGSNQGVKHMNEMPSFFLSETLKYLYLTFDEDNILHRDDDRQWIFTTEAHPIHYVAPKRQQPKAKGTSTAETVHGEFAKDVEALDSILIGRLQGRGRLDTGGGGGSASKDSSGGEGTSRKNIVDHLVKEKWTSAIEYRSYRDDIDGILSREVSRRADDLSVNGHNRTTATATASVADNLVEPIVPPGPFLMDTFGESTISKGNAAHLAFGNWGSGIDLQKACRNLYRSDLLWMLALNGGATDYSDTYVSVGADVLLESPHFFTLLGAADALGALGTGVYFGEKDNEDRLCPISVPAHSSSNEATSQAENDAAQAVAAEGVMQIPSDMGTFEVSSFPDGTGFHIRHLDSGEVLTANVILDEVDTKDLVSMVYSELRAGSSWFQTSDENWERHSDDSHPGWELQRRISTADFAGNSFSCEIELLRKGVEAVDENDVTKEAELVSRIPCSPALFGPSQMSLLKNQDAIVVEAVVQGPKEDNHLGCKLASSPTHGPMPESFIPIRVNDVDVRYGEDEDVVRKGAADDSAEACKNSSVHVVHRGECTFFAKAFNMNKLWKADALIVINHADDNVFMMSSGENERVGIDPIDVPLSVLITGRDGEALLELLNEEAEKPTSIFARISLQRRFDAVDGEGKIVSGDGESRPDRIHWPIVRGNANVLEILVEYGWGIRAVHVKNEEHQEWQLQLLRHVDTNN